MKQFKYNDNQDNVKDTHAVVRYKMKVSKRYKLEKLRMTTNNKLMWNKMLGILQQTRLRGAAQVCKT